MTVWRLEAPTLGFWIIFKLNSLVLEFQPIPNPLLDHVNASCIWTAAHLQPSDFNLFLQYNVIIWSNGQWR